MSSEYYVAGCVDNGLSTEIVDDINAEFWTLYMRESNGESQGIIDCVFREDAIAAMAVYVERDRLNDQVQELRGRLQLVAELNDARAALHGEAEKQVRELAAENASMRIAIDQTIGWQESVDVENTESVRALVDLKTPITDTILNEVRAQGAIDARCALVIAGDGADIYEVVTKVVARIRAGEVPNG